MTTFAGIDFDTHAVHLVLLDEEGAARYRCFTLEGTDALERTRAVRDAMPSRGWWADGGVVAVGIELPFGPNKGRLWPVFGAILSCLPRWLLVQPMTASGWRKHVGLAGNATKQDIYSFAREKAGSNVWLDHWPQDACDAFCLALAVSWLTEDLAA